MSTPWYKNYSNVKDLARWLVENLLITSLHELNRFYDKPWNWDQEWNLYQRRPS